MVDEDLSKLRIDKTKFQIYKRKKKRQFFWIIGLVVLIVGVILYTTGIIKTVISVRVVNVKTVYPSQTLTILNASGYVVAQRKAAIASKITGRLISLSVEEGSRVKKGEIIAQLENEDAKAAVERAKANVDVARFNLERAKADLVDATLTYNRFKELVKQKVISQSEFDSAEARYKSALAAVASAKASLLANEAALKEAEINLDYTFIRVPFGAVVLTKNADIGDIVTPVSAASTARASVVTIADMESLQVEADVSESNIGQVRTGQPCEIQLDALPEDRFRGKVHMIVPTADRSKATVMVKVIFIDKDPRILPEMSARVAFLKRQVEESERWPVKAIPVSAVVSKEGRSMVYKVKGGRVVETEVHLGRELDGMIEVLSGLGLDDVVVLSPVDKVGDGTRIRISED